MLGTYALFWSLFSGKPPKSYGIPAETWAEAERTHPEETEAAKTNYRKQVCLFVIHSKLSKTLEEEFIKLEQSNRLTSKDVVESLLDYCCDVTKQSRCDCCVAFIYLWRREFMQENPNKRLPEDYISYPGKNVCVCNVSAQFPGPYHGCGYQSWIL
jgi:hypothetical protein